MRALIVTAGLLAVVGVAAAATRPHAVTLRYTPTRVDAITQDASFVGWIADGGSRCNLVHVLTPKGEQTIPKPAPKSMTCHWDLSSGRAQLAIAVSNSSALWTLHKSGSAAFDDVMAAKIGGSEAEIERLAHDSDGTGWWLGGLAASGTTLAYSSVDVEYVDKLGCLSGGSCKKEIAGGAIKLVSGTTATPLPGVGPALDLAVSRGRIGYVEATTVAKNGSPAANAVAPVQVVDAHTGVPLTHAQPDGTPLAIALSPHVLAVLTRKGARDRLAWYDAASGTLEGEVTVPRATAPEIGATDTIVVYRVGRDLRGLTMKNGRTRSLALVGPNVVGPSVQHNRVVWAANTGKTARIRSLALG